MEKNDGGPAFPLFADGRAAHHDQSLCYEGMSLRDWYAGLAMSAVLSTKDPKEQTVKAGALARDCYQMATAMLEAREE